MSPVPENNSRRAEDFPEPYLLVEHLAFHYPDDPRPVLEDISFRLYPRQFTALLGESGSGKSTLARLISGQFYPTEGKIQLDGQIISQMTRRQRYRAGLRMQMIFQAPLSSLHPLKTVAWQIEEPLRLQRPKLSATERRERVEAMLHDVGLPAELGTRYPRALSGGQQQRVAIACALITEPKLLIADEIFASLDLSVQAQILNLLMELRSKRDFACLLITHDMDVVYHICDRVLVLHDGRIVEEDKVERVFAAPRAAYTRHLLSAAGWQLEKDFNGCGESEDKAAAGQ